jgi:murein L,D-transpeptidase YcbB/YkuD
VRVRLLAIIAWIATALAAGCESASDSSQGEAKSSSNPAFANVLGAKGITVPTRGRFVLVNIPAFELIALEDGQVMLRSRVIVGKPATPTPELLSSLYAVRFNPSWTPTPTMVRKEGARPVPPGPQNPLGQILFELDNDDLIFLHDTNDRALFDRGDRALSHGCVRVERARALAAWALRKPEDEVARMIATGATRTVPLPQPILVLLAYDARFPEGDGRLKIHRDIHGRRQAAQLHREIGKQTISEGCRPAL